MQSIHFAFKLQVLPRFRRGITELETKSPKFSSLLATVPDGQMETLSGRSWGDIGDTTGGSSNGSSTKIKPALPPPISTSSSVSMPPAPNTSRFNHATSAVLQNYWAECAKE
ncbi:uncharacterized protein E0L32_009920 [Thyridium curvatum]|uniref:Uncharacterized protein n=1 Tax=Thyridium curvatum TaxID=1093900 RepID=A0A507AUJ8_9PEZI|nr:uncharacterized protein E0L32_009920 [Thyridium curvatum]TPX08581.1 hypothetical protein E0L32_009920 [Thyridium curvatum]